MFRFASKLFSRIRIRTALKIVAMATLSAGLTAPAWAAMVTPMTSFRLVPFSRGKVVRNGVRTFSVRPMYLTAAQSVYSKTLHPQFGASGALATVPYWSSYITSPLDKTTYTTTMVGSNPFARTKLNTTVQYVPIIARWHLGPLVWDPTKPMCGDTAAVSSRFYNSPLFHPVLIGSNGVQVSANGGSQLISAFQRANFWASVAHTNYGVTLVPSRSTPIIVDVTAPNTSVVQPIPSSCPGTGTGVTNLLTVEINAYDAIVQQIDQQYATPSQLPLLLTYNVVQYVQTPATCCVLGYHNAIPFAGSTLTYAVGSVIDPGVFAGVDDEVVWSHELGEWMDDPFVQSIPSVTGGVNSDLTPAWGNVGQVSGCQNNLETGDPLSGTEYSLPYNGYLYHYQDLAFMDWFYRTPARGTGQLYSFQGNFVVSQGVCSSSTTVSVPVSSPVGIP
jgi:hypothetical protein